MSQKPIIVVTGANSGLGASIAAELRARDIEVIAYDIQDGEDVREPKDWLSELRRLDGLINCAGVNSNAWNEDVDIADIERVMDINAISLFKMARSVLPQLTKSKGFVLNIVSNAAHIPMTSSLAYNMSKAAALMATRQMAHEWTPKHGITVFSVSPNKLAGTGMSKDIEDSVVAVRGWTPEYAREYQKKALMHGLETPPEAVARMIGHLVTSGDWKYLSGCDIPFGK